MKWNHVAKSVVLALAVLVATSVFAKAVPAGEYQLRWEGTGSNVEVSFMQGKKVVTKAPAKVVELKSAFGNDATVIDRTSSTPSITEVRFAGKKYALEIGGAEKAAMGESTK